MTNETLARRTATMIIAIAPAPMPESESDPPSAPTSVLVPPTGDSVDVPAAPSARSSSGVGVVPPRAPLDASEPAPAPASVSAPVSSLALWLGASVVGLPPPPLLPPVGLVGLAGLVGTAVVAPPPSPPRLFMVVAMAVMVGVVVVVVEDVVVVVAVFIVVVIVVVVVVDVIVAVVVVVMSGHCPSPGLQSGTSFCVGHCLAWLLLGCREILIWRLEPASHAVVQVLKVYAQSSFAVVVVVDVVEARQSFSRCLLLRLVKAPGHCLQATSCAAPITVAYSSMPHSLIFSHVRSSILVGLLFSYWVCEHVVCVVH